MNSAEQNLLRAKVHDALNLYYKPLGFELKKSTGVFERNGMEVSWGVSKKNIDAIYFSPRLNVWNKSITKCFEAIFQMGDLVTSRLTSSRLANDFGNHDYDYLIEEGIDQGIGYKVESESDIKSIFEHHTAYMEKIGFVFFDKMSTLERINNFINSRILEGSELNFINNAQTPYIKDFFNKREVLSGTIAAYLVSEPEIEKLLNRYRIMFEGNDYVLNDLEKVVDYFNNALSAKQ